MIALAPGETVDWLSVSGIGEIRLIFRIYCAGIPAGDSDQENLLDGYSARGAQCCDIGDCDFYGFTDSGTVYANRLYVLYWNTVKDIYEIRYLNVYFPETYPQSHVERFRNAHDVSTAYMLENVQYALLASSSRALLKLKEWIDASTLRELSGVKDLRHPVIAHRLGYFEDEERHPYRDFLTDLPNLWDHEYAPEPPPPPIRGASSRVQNFVCELHYPTNWSVERALGHIKPDKILYET